MDRYVISKHHLSQSSTEIRTFFYVYLRDSYNLSFSAFELYYSKGTQS